MSNLLKKVVAGFSTAAMVASSLLIPASTVAAATAGGVYSTPDGTVWFVTSDMQKRPFTSAGAFLSYGFLSFSQVTPADASVTALPTGSFIAPQDGRIFCATETKGSDVAGECSLVTAGQKAAFTSAAVFSGLGFSFSRAFYGDSSFLTKTSNIDNTSAAHRPGVLVNNNGTVQLVVSGGLWGVPSLDVFNSWGWSFADVVPANAADKAMSQIGIIPGRVAGQLVPTATAGVTPTPTGVVGDCNLSGNAGDATVTQDSTLSSEEVGEGEEEVGILGFEVEADDDSDIAVTSVRVAFYQSDTDVSQDLEDYVDEVQIMHGDDVVATADPDSFNEDSDIFTKSISLDCAEVMAGETGDFSVAVTGAGTFDSADILDDNWAVDLYSLRFEDADGVTSTVTIDDSDITTVDAGAIDETMEFVDFATAADVELATSLTDDADDINEAHNVIVEDDADTDDIEILAFTLEAEGDSDIMVKDIPVTITGVESGADDLDTIISSADLYHGTTLVDSQNISDTTPDGIVQVIFEDVDVDINEGDSEDFTVKVNALELENNYSQGTTLQATVNTTSIDADDEQGDQLSGAAELSGSAIGEAVSLFSAGITVDVDSADTNVIVNDSGFDSVEFVWELTITNIGEDDVYINSDNAQIAVADGADPVVNNRYAFDDGAGTLTSLSGTITDDGATEVTSAAGEYTGQSFYRLSSGESETFTITVTGTNSVAAAQMQAWLTEIEWTTDDVTSFVGTETIAGYVANIVDESETPFKLVN